MTALKAKEEQYSTELRSLQEDLDSHRYARLDVGAVTSSANATALC